MKDFRKNSRKTSKRIKERDRTYNTLIFSFSIILLLSLFVLSSYSSFKFKEELSSYILELKPLETKALFISSIECGDNCSSFEEILTYLSNFNINFSEKNVLILEKDNSSRELISKYNLKKLPALILFGEFSRSSFFDDLSRYGRFYNNTTLIIETTRAPFFNLSLNSVEGLVDLIILRDKNCKECFDMTQLSKLLSSMGVVLKNISIKDIDLSVSKDYSDLSRLPLAFISKDIKYYPKAFSVLKQLGLLERDNSFLLYPPIPPYRNISSGKIVGLVDVILIDADNCDDCYDVYKNVDILRRFGIYINSITSYNLSDKEAKDLLLKYNLSKVPTILVSPEAKYYSNFVNAWRSVGMISNVDGWFIMTKPESLGKVKRVKV